MSKKDKFNNWDETPKRIDRQKTGDTFSFFTKKKELEIPGDTCGFLPVPDPINLLPKGRGRAEGGFVVYSPDDAYNYLSVSERYERSINLVPAYIQDGDNGSKIYGFCSQTSPNGYWEVVVESENVLASFITLTPQFLTILCPRPFQLSELVQLETDSPTIAFTQISGSRTTLIEPPDSFDPVINILNACLPGGVCDEDTQQPIIIRVETDNPLVLTDLVIFNRAIDFWDGLGYDAETSDIVCRRVSEFRIAPLFLQQAYEWQCAPINVVWLNPACDNEFIKRYRVQRLNPPYTDIAVIPFGNNQIIQIDANQRYRVVTDFEILGAPYTSISEPFFYNCPIPNTKIVLADDSTRNLGYSTVNAITTTVEFGVIIQDLTDTVNSVLGYSPINTINVTVEFGVIPIDLSEDVASIIGYSPVNSLYEKVDLGGVIIG